MVSRLPPAAPASEHRAAGTLTGAQGILLASTLHRVPAPVQPLGSVLFAHGFGQTRGAWNRTAAALAAHGFEAHSYDARGHGESDRNAPGEAYSVEQLADDLIIVAGELAEPPVLVGASMGGLFGLIAESRWPGLFRALVLVDVTPRWEQAGMERILAFMTAFPQGFDSLDHAGEVIAAYLPQRRARKSPQELQELLRQDDHGRWRWHWDPRLLEEMVHDSAAHQDALADAARTVRCPVMLISGGRSDLVSRQTIDEFETLVPHATHIHIPEATHMVAGDDNDTFTTAVLHYLTQLPAVTVAQGPAAAGQSDVTESVSGANP